MSPGLTSVPSRLRGTWTAWGLASAPVPTIEVPLDQICSGLVSLILNEWERYEVTAGLVVDM